MSNPVERRLEELERRMNGICKSHDALKARCEDDAETIKGLQELGEHPAVEGPTTSEILDEETENEEKEESTDPLSG